MCVCIQMTKFQNLYNGVSHLNSQFILCECKRFAYGMSYKNSRLLCFYCKKVTVKYKVVYSHTALYDIQILNFNVYGIKSFKYYIKLLKLIFKRALQLYRIIVTCRIPIMFKCKRIKFVTCVQAINQNIVFIL